MFEERVRKRTNPEGHTQLAILHYLKAKGFVIGKTKTMGVRRGRSFCFDPYCFRGFPDLTCFTPNLCFIEVKSPTGTMSDDQKSFQNLCNRANIPYILARSLDDIIKIFG
jgi:hypothetical protein